jgi:hypothetical protein
MKMRASCPPFGPSAVATAGVRNALSGWIRMPVGPRPPFAGVPKASLLE